MMSQPSRRSCHLQQNSHGARDWRLAVRPAANGFGVYVQPFGQNPVGQVKITKQNIKLGRRECVLELREKRHSDHV
jgi:hypothetical protein